MRLLFTVLALPLLLPAATAAQSPEPPTIQPPGNAGRALAMTKSNCRKTTSYHAEIGSWRGGNVAPRKLTELPPAEGYKAVYRTANGCEEPMTVAEYQRGILR